MMPILITTAVLAPLITLTLWAYFGPNRGR